MADGDRHAAGQLRYGRPRAAEYDATSYGAVTVERHPYAVAFAAFSERVFPQWQWSGPWFERRVVGVRVQ